MARAGRKDRGLPGKNNRQVRLCGMSGSLTTARSGDSGAFKNKTAARDFYEKAKQEQKPGRFFLNGISMVGRNGLRAVIARYLTTLPTSGKKPRPSPRGKHHGRWWTDRLTGRPCTP